MMGLNDCILGLMVMMPKLPGRFAGKLLKGPFSPTDPMVMLIPTIHHKSFFGTTMDILRTIANIPNHFLKTPSQASINGTNATLGTLFANVWRADHILRFRKIVSIELLFVFKK
jgi:hypothetical protein